MSEKNKKIGIFLIEEEPLFIGLISEILESKNYEYKVLTSVNDLEKKSAELGSDVLIIRESKIKMLSNKLLDLLSTNLSRKILIAENDIEEISNQKFGYVVIPLSKISEKLTDTIRNLTEKKHEIEPIKNENEDLIYYKNISSLLFHELNNCLSGLFINLRILSEENEKKNLKWSETIYKIESAAKQMQENLNNFVNYLNCGSFPLERNDLNQLLSQIVLEKKSLIQKKFLNSKIDYDVDIPFLKINRVVMSKLFANAIDYFSSVSNQETELVISTINSLGSVTVKFSLLGKMSDEFLFNQIFNPLFPNKMIEENASFYLRDIICKINSLEVKFSTGENSASIEFKFKK